MLTVFFYIFAFDKEIIDRFENIKHLKIII
jgi:hypothetical protein